MISRRSVLAAGVLAPVGWAAAAETRYPAHSVTVVNPFAAGGQSEPVGRIVSAHFQSVLGQPFVMENRVGAGSTIGGQYVARSAPDGYTLLLGTTSTFTIAPYVYRPQPYDPITNLAPIIALTEAPTVLVASEKSGFRSLEDLVRAAKQGARPRHGGFCGHRQLPARLRGSLFVARRGATDARPLPRRRTGDERYPVGASGSFLRSDLDGRAASAIQTRLRTARDRKRPILSAAGRTDSLGARLSRPEPHIVDRACSSRGNSRSDRRASEQGGGTWCCSRTG